MGFLFGLLTGIFAFVATLAIVVMHVLKLNLDLPEPKVKTIHNGTSEEAVSVEKNSHALSDISEARLRQMIQKIVAETISLPPLTNGHAVGLAASNRTDKRFSNSAFNQRHRTEHYFEPAIYQDLLATAVLNKIVDRQLKNIQNSSNRETETGDDDLNGNLRQTRSDQNFNAEKLSSSSGSSVEPRSDCSFPEEEQIFNNNDDKSSELLRNSDRDSVMSDYLANHMIPLPELNAMATESEDDDYTSVTSSAVGDETWEKNWLFKKKRSALNGSVTTSSIGILVPDPKEDVRAQIGDKTADEVSDLSELGSDSDDSLNSLRSQLDPINDRLINKHLIGGQNSKIILDELIERSSMISNTLPSDAESGYTDARNEHIINAKVSNEAINDNVNQQQQQQSPTEQKAASEVLKDLNSNSLTGSIAEREYKKWYNAVEMPNNPYAPEALKRRISGSQERFIDLPNISPTKDLNTLNLLSEPTMEPIDADNVKLENDYKRYSRDYYINSSLTASQIIPAKDPPANVAKENREATNITTTSCRNAAETENYVYKARPAQVIEEDLTTMETTSPTSTPMDLPANLMSASEDSDTIKLTDIKSGKVGAEEKPCCSVLTTKPESAGNSMAAGRGSTPVAFKFLQPKRKLLEPNQVLTVDEEGPKVASSQWEKPVIEEEVAKALPSVKALAKAFLMTTNKTQPEKLWLRKAKTLSQGGRKRAASPKRSLDQLARLERDRAEDDVTITSDLSSLETDSSSMGAEYVTSCKLTIPAGSSPNDPPSNPDPVRQGVLRSNIAFFENLKNK